MSDDAVARSLSDQDRDLVEGTHSGQHLGGVTALFDLEG
jgi:hypothetical protein